MSKDKKSCSSCSKNVDSKILATSNGSVQDVIDNFKKNAQTVQPKKVQNFDSNGDKYIMRTISKTERQIIDNKINVELTILHVIYKYDTLKKKYNLFGYFTSTQVLDKNEKDITHKYYKNPTKFINLKLSMIIIGQLINTNNNVKITHKLKSTKLSNSSKDCCNKNNCMFGAMSTYSSVQSDGSTNYKCDCTYGPSIPGVPNPICYNSNGDNCTETGCNNGTTATVSYEGTSAGTSNIVAD